MLDAFEARRLDITDPSALGGCIWASMTVGDRVMLLRSGVLVSNNKSLPICCASCLGMEERADCPPFILLAVRIDQWSGAAAIGSYDWRTSKVETRPLQERVLTAKE